jgi:hypothetical protein
MIAKRTPDASEPASIPPRASVPSNKPISKGATIASRPGAIIS